MSINFSKHGKWKIAAQSVVIIATSIALIILFAQNITSGKLIGEIFVSAALALISIAFLKPALAQLWQLMVNGPAIYLEDGKIVFFGGFGKRKFDLKSITSLSVQESVIEIHTQNNTIRMPRSYYDASSSSSFDQITNIIKNRSNR